MKWYSPSKLKGFYECARRFRLEPFKDGPALALGRFRHTVLERWLRAGSGPIAPHFHAAMEEKVDGAQHADQGVLDDLEAYTRKYPRPAPGDVMSIEGEPAFPEGFHLYEDKTGRKLFAIRITDEWGIRGVMDLVYYDAAADEIVIIDHKGRTEEDILIQGMTYLLAGFLMWGYPGVRIRFEARGIPPYWSEALHGKESGPQAGSEMLFAQAEQAIRQLVAKLQAAEAADEWPATVGKGCDWCGVRDGCPALGNPALVEAPKSWLPPKLSALDAPELVKIADKVNTYSKALEAIDKTVKEILIPKMEAAGGSVEVDGKPRKLQTRDNFDDDTAQLLAIATELGIDLGPFKVLDYSALKEEMQRVMNALPDKDVWIAKFKAARRVKFTSKWLVTPRGHISIAGLLPESLE